MSDTTLRIGTLSVLVPGTIMAVTRLLGAGPDWLLAVSQVLIVIGLVGTLTLRRRATTAGTTAPGTTP